LNQVLTLLRTGVDGFMKPDQIAFARSRAYRKLNELVPAVAFIDEAVRRNPAVGNYHGLAMHLLYQDQRFDEAYERARAYLGDSKTLP
jgi:hypothetical protein